MTLIRRISSTAAATGEGLRRFACLYALGGPVGVFYAVKLARLKRRMANVATYIDREKELNRAHLTALNHELTELVMQQRCTSVAAAQFWKWCEEKAGLQP